MVKQAGLVQVDENTVKALKAGGVCEKTARRLLKIQTACHGPSTKQKNTVFSAAVDGFIATHQGKADEVH